MAIINENDFYEVRLTGNYGTFEVMKVVTVTASSRADATELAEMETGIGDALRAEGWIFTDSPEGEEWTTEILRKF